MLLYILLCVCALSALRQSRARAYHKINITNKRVYGGYLWRAQCHELRHEVIPRAALYLNQTRGGKGPEKCCLNAQKSRQGGSFPCMRT